MAYVPPAGNAVNFNFTRGYLVPLGNALLFNFGASDGRRRIMLMFITT
jgi:hypothetical protein